MDGRRWRAAVAAGTILAATLLTSGCQAAPSDAGDLWASEFRLAAEQAATQEERDALADGKITDQEYAYFQNEILECLSAIGVTASWGDEGELNYDPAGAEESAIDECYAGKGARLLTLRDAILRNPKHLDPAKILVDCLRRAGLVGPEYTTDDLEGGVEMARLQESPDFGACAADPLHHG